MADKAKPAVREWTVEQKACIFVDASDLDGEEVTAYLQREGVRLAEYEQWRIALDEGGQTSASTNKCIRQLERELARKEKAVAEAAALFVLKKRGDTLRGGRGRRHERREREVIIEIISAAQVTGVRLASACRMLGIGSNRRALAS